MAKKLIRLYLLTMILFVLAGCIEHSQMDKNQDNNRMDYVHVNEDKFICLLYTSDAADES